VTAACTASAAEFFGKARLELVELDSEYGATFLVVADVHDFAAGREALFLDTDVNVHDGTGSNAFADLETDP
jgi:hypothetical protein